MNIVEFNDLLTEWRIVRQEIEQIDNDSEKAPLIDKERQLFKLIAEEIV